MRSKPDQEIRLRNFTAMPQRCMGDRRLYSRHFRVLAVICRSVDKTTLAALISQSTISKKASLARQKVGAVIEDLKRWGYLEPIGRGRTQDGRFRTKAYRINYDRQDDDIDTGGGDRGHVTLGGEITASPPEVAVSNILESNISASSKQDPRHVRCKACSAFKDRSSDPAQQETHPGLRQIDRKNREEKDKSKQHEALNQLARRKADRFENNRVSICRGRLIKEIIRSFPEELAGSVVEAITEVLLDRAARLEVRDPGAGAELLQQAVTKHLATKS